MAKGTLVFRGETYEKQPSGLSGATEPMMWPRGQGATEPMMWSRGQGAAVVVVAN